MSPTDKTMTPKQMAQETLARQVTQTDRVLQEARQMLQDLAREKRARLIRDGDDRTDRV